MEIDILKRLFTASAAVKAVFLGGVCLASLVSTANAAQFGVRVIDETGEPVTGASVCFGLPGSYRQFGAVFTDSDGQAIAEVPNIPIVVTVSKTRFSGIRLNEPGRGFNLIKEITLTEGIPGPRCKAGSTLADYEPSSVVVDNVEVVVDNQSKILRPEASGEPTEYRVSSTPDIELSRWEDMKEDILLPSAMASESEVYLQLRRYEGTQTNWLEARSRVFKIYLPPAEES